MKRTTILIVFAAALVFSASGQTDVFKYESRNYLVYSEVSDDNARETSEKLEAFASVYNELFHFPLSELETKLRVRILSGKDRFNNFLSVMSVDEKDDFVYLQYSSLQRSELLGFFMEPDAFNESLSRQCLIQLLRSFVKNPPVWLQEGLIVYFDKTAYDPVTKTVTYTENLDWLYTLKNLLGGESVYLPLPLNDILVMDRDEALENRNVFYPMAWGMISFLINSGDSSYNRLIWETLTALRKTETDDEKESASYVRQSIFGWYDDETLASAFGSYLESRKTFLELIEDGVAYYREGEYEKAQKSFEMAVQRNASHHSPYYHLGLISYVNKDYASADSYYQLALEMDGPEALVNYALGLNAYEEGRFEEARTYLEKAASLEPETYENKANEIINKIEVNI